MQVDAELRSDIVDHKLVDDPIGFGPVAAEASVRKIVQSSEQAEDGTVRHGGSPRSYDVTDRSRPDVAACACNLSATKPAPTTIACARENSPATSTIGHVGINTEFLDAVSLHVLRVLPQYSSESFNHASSSTCTDVSRADDRRGQQPRSPAPARQRPQPMSVRIPCNECDGAGCYTLAYSLDPYGKTYECELCAGTGDAVCVVCGDPAVDFDEDGEPRCGHHLPAEELDPDRLREDRDERRAA